MALIHERDWTKKDRAAWWTKYVIALGAGIGGVQAADQAVSYFLSRSGFQTVAQSHAETVELKREADEKMLRIEQKLDRLMSRVDELYARAGK